MLGVSLTCPIHVSPCLPQPLKSALPTHPMSFFSSHTNLEKYTTSSLKVSFHGFEGETPQELRKKVHRDEMGRVVPELRVGSWKE